MECTRFIHLFIYNLLCASNFGGIWLLNMKFIVYGLGYLASYASRIACETQTSEIKFFCSLIFRFHSFFNIILFQLINFVNQGPMHATEPCDYNKTKNHFFDSRLGFWNVSEKNADLLHIYKNVNNDNFFLLTKVKFHRSCVPLNSFNLVFIYEISAVFQFGQHGTILGDENYFLIGA